MTLVDRRADFADFGGVTYLNCAYQGPMPRVAVEALEAAVRRKTHPHENRDQDYFDLPDAYRSAVGELLARPANEIAITDSTTMGMNLLARGLDWNEGDEIVLPRGEFPANRFPWLGLEREGVVVREVEMPAGATGVDRVLDAIGPRTRLVTLAWVRYQTGERRDLRPIGERCRERGVLFAIDASQGIGGLPFDLDEIPCDLVACSGYKWMLGPYGLGFVWLAPGLAERLEPPSVNWFAIEGARDFNRLADCRLSFEAGARRFDINETANFFNVPTATAALRYLLAVGVDRAAEHVAVLRRRLAAGLPDGYRLLGDEEESVGCSNIFCVTAEREELLERAVRRLAVLRVELSRREGALRVSPFVYNRGEDIDRLLAGLTEAAAT